MARTKRNRAHLFTSQKARECQKASTESRKKRTEHFLQQMEPKVVADVATTQQPAYNLRPRQQQRNEETQHTDIEQQNLSDSSSNLDDNNNNNNNDNQDYSPYNPTECSSPPEPPSSVSPTLHTAHVNQQLTNQFEQQQETQQQQQDYYPQYFTHEIMIANASTTITADRCGGNDESHASLLSSQQDQINYAYPQKMNQYDLMYSEQELFLQQKCQEMRYVSSPQNGTSPHLLAQEEEYCTDMSTLNQHMASSNSNKLPRRPVRFAVRQVKNRYTTTTNTTTGGKKQCSPQTNHVMSDNYLSQQQQQYTHPTSFMLSSQQPQQQEQQYQHEYLQQQQQTTILSTPQPTCMQQLMTTNSQSYNVQQQQQQQQQYTSTEYYGINNNNNTSTFMQTPLALDLSMVEPLSFPSYNQQQQQNYTYGNNNVTNLNSPKMIPQSRLNTPTQQQQQQQHQQTHLFDCHQYIPACLPTICETPVLSARAISPSTTSPSGSQNSPLFSSTPRLYGTSHGLSSSSTTSTSTTSTYGDEISVNCGLNNSSRYQSPVLSPLVIRNQTSYTMSHTGSNNYNDVTNNNNTTTNNNNTNQPTSFYNYEELFTPSASFAQPKFFPAPLQLDQ